MTNAQPQTHSVGVADKSFNHSTARVAINMLPLEILDRIFSTAVASSPCPLTSGGTDILPHIPLVCARWYQAATGNRSLWSHIDIGSCMTSTTPLQTNRNRLWLERSHGVPVHLHSDIDHPQSEVAIVNFVSLLEPHRASTISLVTTGMNLVLARALFTLYLGGSGSGALSTLVVSGAWDKELALPWPLYPIRGLTVLELCNLQKPACPALDELTAMLSDCPYLHTLRLLYLRDFIVRPGRQQTRSTISLPHLKLLELAIPAEQALVALITMLQPGQLELHVRLGIQPIGRGPVPCVIQSLLTRSNVGSLALPRLDSHDPTHIRSLFSCVPHLRALLTEHMTSAVWEVLANYDISQSLPNLQLLCFSGGHVYPHSMDHLRSLVGTRQLRSLLFWSCKFPAPNRENPNYVELQDKDEDEDGDGGLALGSSSGISTVYRNFMPRRTKEWMLKYVERIVICETPPARVVNGLDVLALEIAKLD